MSVRKTVLRNIAIAAAVVVLCGWGALWALGSMLFPKSMRTRASVVISLPDGVHAVAHSRIRTHPLVGEFSRDVTYISGGARGKTTPLSKDTCGGYPINCYWIETARGPFLRLDDAVSEHLLDLTTQTTYRVARVQGTAYVGGLTDEHVAREWSMRNHDPSTLSVTIGDAVARPMADLTQNAPEVYIGRILGGSRRCFFIPAATSPETAIRHLDDR